MAQNLTITKLYTTAKKKDGTPITDKQGRPLLRVSIKTQEYGDKWLSGFVYPSQVAMLGIGKTVQADVSQRMFNGQTELVFRLARNRAGGVDKDALREVVREELAEVLAILGKIERHLNHPTPEQTAPPQPAPVVQTQPAAAERQEIDIDPDDIPF